MKFKAMPPEWKSGSCPYAGNSRFAGDGENDYYLEILRKIVIANYFTHYTDNLYSHLLLRCDCQTILKYRGIKYD